MLRLRKGHNIVGGEGGSGRDGDDSGVAGDSSSDDDGENDSDPAANDGAADGDDKAMLRTSMRTSAFSASSPVKGVEF